MTEERRKLIEKFDKWLNTDPLKSIAGIQCANIAEDYADEQLKLNGINILGKQLSSTKEMEIALRNTIKKVGKNKPKLPDRL